MSSLHAVNFRAMDTRIDLMYRTGKPAVSDVERLAIDWFQAAEARFSRFLANSELSQLNRVAGARCMVSEPMLEVLLLAEAYTKLTDGAFNPLILNALEHAGYQETFDLVKRRDEFLLDPEEIRVMDRAELSIDPIMRSIRIPAQSKLDLGGIVKSWATHGLAATLKDQLAHGLVNAGGDLVAWGGHSPDGDPWVIGIENPWDPGADIGMIALLDGAAATSSKLGRQWPTSRGMMHHLIDPNSMRPSDSEVVQCTVVGPQVVACEIWAKTICIRGIKNGLSLLSRNAQPYEALLFTSDRRIHYYGSESSLGRAWHGLPIDRCYYKQPAIT